MKEKMNSCNNCTTEDVDESAESYNSLAIVDEECKISEEKDKVGNNTNSSEDKNHTKSKIVRDAE